MKRLPFRSLLTTTACIGALGALVACGGISDPTKSGAGETVATVSGALTGATVPDGTRVALVWKVGTTHTYAVTSDVAVIGGKFTMDLSAPSDSYFFSADQDYSSLSGGSSGSGGVATVDAPPKDSSGSSGSSGSTSSGGGGSSGGSSSGGSSGFNFNFNASPRTNVSGGITQPLTVALAGFVVYADTNGNGKLDIDATEYVVSTDTILGGNSELMLAYLRDGGALDYEKLRDKSGIAPVAGYNLMWDQGRWFPLNEVELKLKDHSRLPGAVCSGSGVEEVSSSGSSSSGSAGTPTPTPVPSGGSSGSDPNTFPQSYPAPGDPNLTCSDDGYTYYYTPPVNCDGVVGPTPPAPPADGLCSGTYYDSDAPTKACAVPASEPVSIKPGGAVPAGWPCPVADNDAGPPASDAGVPDAK